MTAAWASMRRSFPRFSAAAAAATIAAPHIRTAGAAGRVTFAAWDHWVPGANDNMTKLCQEWGRRNNVEVQIDYITSVGFKGIVTAAAEAQAGAGHDIFAHPTWQVSIHRHVLEPMDDVMAALEKENGAVDEVVRYLAKGTLVGVRLQPDQLAAVDAWISEQPEPRPTRPEAIRRLMERGIAASTPSNPA